MELKKKGFYISSSNLSKQLRNPFYMGKIIVPKLDKELAQIIEGLHDGIITEKIFFEVQNILNGKIIHKKPSYVFLRPEYPLRGILYCEFCNSLLTASKSRSATGRRYSYYHCNDCRKTRHASDNLNKVFEQILDDFTFIKPSKTLYELMVKEFFNEGKEDSSASINSLKEKIKDIDLRIEKLEDLFVDGNIEKQNYRQNYERYSLTKAEILRTIEIQNSVSDEYKSWLKSGVNILADMKNHYLQSDVADKQKLISSIFPEKISFDGDKCRTTRINDVLRCILQINSDLEDKKSGQFSKKLELSTLVESGRIELPSKQVTKELSSRLFSD